MICSLAHILVCFAIIWFDIKDNVSYFGVFTTIMPVKQESCLDMCIVKFPSIPYTKNLHRTHDCVGYTSDNAEISFFWIAWIGEDKMPMGWFC